MPIPTYHAIVIVAMSLVMYSIPQCKAQFLDFEEGLGFMMLGQMVMLGGRSRLREEAGFGGAGMDMAGDMIRRDRMGAATVDHRGSWRSSFTGGGIPVFGGADTSPFSSIDVISSKTSLPAKSPSIQTAQSVQIAQVPQVITQDRDTQSAQIIQREQALQGAQIMQAAHMAEAQAQSQAEAAQAEYQVLAQEQARAEAQTIHASQAQVGYQGQAQAQTGFEVRAQTGYQSGARAQTQAPGGISPGELQAHVSTTVQTQLQYQQGAEAQPQARAQAQTLAQAQAEAEARARANDQTEALQAQQLQRSLQARERQLQNMFPGQSMAAQRSPMRHRAGVGGNPLFWAMLFE